MIQRGAHIVQIGRQPLQPDGLLLALQQRRGALGQRQVVRQVAGGDPLTLAAAGQLLVGVLAQDDQQAVAGLAVGGLGRLDHALVDQRSQPLDAGQMRPGWRHVGRG